MIPETLLGIVVFAAAAGPGYVYVQLAERYAPRRGRSPLEEAAELLVVGSVSTGVAFLAALAAVAKFDVFSTVGLAADPSNFVLEHPLRALALAAGTLALAYGGVWVAASQLVFRGSARNLEPGGSMWYVAFKKLVPARHGTLVTIERRDGSTLTGLLGSATADDTTTREVLLIAPENRPIYARESAGSEIVALYDTFVIVQLDDIKTLSGRYLPTSAPTSTEAAGAD